MVSRSKWEDMTGSIKSALGLEDTPEKKVNKAADQLGGGSGKAVQDLRNHKKKTEDALREAGAL